MGGRDPALRAEHPEIPAEHALSGFVGVRAYSAAPERSAELLEEIMGAERVGDDIWELRGDGRGATIAFDAPPDERRLSGAGTVHHVAWATTKEEHPLWQEKLVAAGVHVTPVIDRYYFNAMYFREPSGVLYEISDNGPGFTRDMPVEELGSRVILPAWLEEQRAEVEARLTPLPDPRAGWTRALVTAVAEWRYLAEPGETTTGPAAPDAARHGRRRARDARARALAAARRAGARAARPGVRGRHGAVLLPHPSGPVHLPRPAGAHR